MPIISVSVDEKTLSELKRLEGELEFAGRSDAVRAAIRALASENRQRQSLSGAVKCVLLAVHGEADEDRANRGKHEFEDVISTQVHSNLGGKKCLEIFVLDGDAKRVKEFVRKMQSNRGIEQVRLIVP